MKKHFPSLVCGFGAGVLQVVPILKGFACCLILPVAALLSVVLYQKANGITTKIEMSKALVIGLVTGLFAAIFGAAFEIIITYITHNNDITITFGELQNLIYEFPVDESVKQEVIDMLSGMVEQIQTTGFSIIYSFTIIINNLITNVIFGMVGGIFGGQYWNAKMVKRTYE